VSCTRCGEQFDAIEVTDDQGRTIDTVGGMHFDEGWTCDQCLGKRLGVGESKMAAQVMWREFGRRKAVLLALPAATLSEAENELNQVVIGMQDQWLPWGIGKSIVPPV
jgi:hypothetical protein